MTDLRLSPGDNFPSSPSGSLYDSAESFARGVKSDVRNAGWITAIGNNVLDFSRVVDASSRATWREWYHLNCSHLALRYTPRGLLRNWFIMLILRASKKATTTTTTNNVRSSIYTYTRHPRKTVRHVHFLSFFFFLREDPRCHCKSTPIATVMSRIAANFVISASLLISIASARVRRKERKRRKKRMNRENEIWPRETERRENCANWSTYALVVVALLMGAKFTVDLKGRLLFHEMRKLRGKKRNEKTRCSSSERGSGAKN